MVAADAAMSRGSKTLFVKFVVIALVSVVILVALAWVSWIIRDREDYRQAAVKSILESYASGQRFVGPVLVQPYTVTATVSAGAEPKELPGDILSFPRRWTCTVR
jgi:inner membrane protein involved in colicin E2 resistance